MKCDICYTMIPIGKNRCPNCGYVIKKSTGIKSTTMEFDHIEEPDTMPNFDHIKDRIKMPTFDHISQPKPKSVNSKFAKDTQFKMGTAISVILFIAFYLFMYIFVLQ